MDLVTTSAARSYGATKEKAGTRDVNLPRA